MSRFLTREVSIFYPYADELPEDLLRLGGAAPALLEDLRHAPFIRVAKLEERIIGAYLMADLGAQSYRIEALAVEPRQRGRGLGGWMVGHAIGVAESKGGRRVTTAWRYRGGLFDRLGFACEPSARWRLEITPE